MTGGEQTREFKLALVLAYQDIRGGRKTGFVIAVMTPLRLDGSSIGRF